jgi:transcriptional regulator with XRE-family HTH domain
VGKSLNIGGRTIGNYESGERLPSLDTLVKIADFYGVSVDYLLGRTDNRLINTADAKVSLFEKLPPEGQEEMKTLLNFMRHKYLDNK